MCAKPGDCVGAEIQRTVGRLRPSSFKCSKGALQDFKTEQKFLFLGLLTASCLSARGLAAAVGADPLCCLTPLGSPSRALQPLPFLSWAARSYPPLFSSFYDSPSDPPSLFSCQNPL